MLEADEKIFQLVCKYSGLYMRYSDDFIIVLPQISDECFETILKDTLTIVNSIPNLILQSEKTQIFRYQSPMLTSCSSLYLEGGSNGKNEIDYLGFSFDGERITIRDKTITKYYYRMYRKLKTIVNSKGYTRRGNRISCQNLYEKYSVKGAWKRDVNGHIKGNFLTYVQRAQKIFGEDEPIDRKTRKHMLKIRRVLDQVFKNHSSV